MDYICLLEMPSKEEYRMLTKEECDELGYDFVTLVNNDQGTLDIIPILSHMKTQSIYIRLKDGYISKSVEDKISNFELIELEKQPDGHYINTSNISVHKTI